MNSAERNMWGLKQRKWQDDGGKVELHNLYITHKIIRLIKPRRMRWTGHMTCTVDKWNYGLLLVGKTWAEYTPLKTQAQTGIWTLKQFFQKQDGRVWTGFTDSRQEPMASSCKYDNETSWSIQCRCFLTCWGTVSAEKFCSMELIWQHSWAQWPQEQLCYPRDQ